MSQAITIPTNSSAAPPPAAAATDDSVPVRDDTDVEDDLAEDVRSERLDVVRHLKRGFAADEGVGLRVAADAHVVDAVPGLCHRREQPRRPVELFCRSVDVAGDREDVADAEREEPLQDVPQVLLVSDEASC